MQKTKQTKRKTAGSDGSHLKSHRAYQKPVLIAYGDVRDVTLGPTEGLAESGAELTRRNS